MDNDEEHDRFALLLDRARARDSAATNEIFERFYPVVRRMVHHSLSADLRRSRPWATARFSTGDIVQEVFRSVLTDLPAFGGESERAFAGYLAMVVRNRIIDALRFHEAERRDGRRSAPPISDAGHPPEDASPDRIAEGSDELRRMYELIAEFPERERLLLRARFENTASFDELKSVLGYSSVTSTRRAYFAAHARLAVQLGISETKEGNE